MTTSGGTVYRRQLGMQLRALRETAGLSTTTVSERLDDMSQAKVSRLERGVGAPKIRDVEALLRLYGAEDARVATLLDLAREAKKQDWWQPYRNALTPQFQSFMSLQEAARGVRAFEVLHVPGLLQTEDYARAIFDTNVSARPEELEGRVAVRMERQKLLTREDPPHLWVVLDEAVLSRPVGGRQVMRKQLQRLLDVQELGHVTLRVVPFTRGAHTAMYGPFVLLDFEAEPSVLFLDTHTGGLSTANAAGVRRFDIMWENLRAISAGPDEGADLIREKAKQL